MIKKFMFILFVFLIVGCNQKPQTNNQINVENIVDIQLSDHEIKVSKEDCVNIANDIIYYEEGKDFTYGEGTQSDAHSKEEANQHQVIHITKAGTYRLSGTLSKGQIAVDLGEEAKEDETAVVTLILDNVNITCDVAPGIIFYNVYECANDEATKDVDTSNAGANILVGDGTENTISGAYVSKIYKPESVVLNETETEVVDAKKLHKYDGAVYSKMSMNIEGKDGVLNINAKNEGLDTEMHLTINGGNINIKSGNDGINTNEDGVSVTTINGGNLYIEVTGETGEGDGIDSNGWLVINGGSVTAYACANSADAGIDSDMGIHINGGEVVATGNMLDRIENGGQKYIVFNINQRVSDGLSIKDEEDNSIKDIKTINPFSILIYSHKDIKNEVYSLWQENEIIATSSNGLGHQFGGPGGMPFGDQPPMNGDFEHPNNGEFTPPNGEFHRPDFKGTGKGPSIDL